MFVEGSNFDGFSLYARRYGGDKSRICKAEEQVPTTCKLYSQGLSCHLLGPPSTNIASRIITYSSWLAVDGGCVGEG